MYQIVFLKHYFTRNIPILHLKSYYNRMETQLIPLELFPCFSQKKNQIQVENIPIHTFFKSFILYMKKAFWFPGIFSFANSGQNYNRMAITTQNNTIGVVSFFPFKRRIQGKWTTAFFELLWIILFFNSLTKLAALHLVANNPIVRLYWLRQVCEESRTWRRILLLYTLTQQEVQA